MVNHITESTADSVSVVSQGTALTVVSTMSNHLTTICTNMLPFFYAAIPLILMDLHYGRRIAKARYEKTKDRQDAVTIKKSFKMTVQKVFNYLGWILLSSTLAFAFNSNSIMVIIMIIIYGIELLSLLDKWAQTKGLDVDEAGALRLILKHIWLKFTGIEDDFKEVIHTTEETKENKRKKRTSKEKPQSEN